MLSTLEDGIPLFHMTYKGNTQDAKHFKSVISKIHTRFDQYEQQLSSLVLIFDKGNHSPDAFKQIDDLELLFIASLRNSTQKDLLEIPENSFISIELPNNGKKVLYYTVQREVYDKIRTLYVTLDLKKQNKHRILFSKKLTTKQETINKFLKEKLNEKKWRSQENVERKLQRIIGKFPFKDIIKYEITGDFAQLKVTVTIVEEVKERYISSLGRSILFTNITTWKPITIIQAFRDKYIIEDIFRRLKNPHYLSIRPMYHWNNTCVRVHVFCCFLGFLLLSLLRKELKHESIQTSYDEMFEVFSSIKMTKINLSSKDKPLLKFNRMNQRAKEFFDTLKLKSFLSE